MNIRENSNQVFTQRGEAGGETYKTRLFKEIYTKLHRCSPSFQGALSTVMGFQNESRSCGQSAPHISGRVWGVWTLDSPPAPWIVAIEPWALMLFLRFDFLIWKTVVGSGALDVTMAKQLGT